MWDGRWRRGYVRTQARPERGGGPAVVAPQARYAGPFGILWPAAIGGHAVLQDSARCAQGWSLRISTVTQEVTSAPNLVSTSASGYPKSVLSAQPASRSG